MLSCKRESILDHDKIECIDRMDRRAHAIAEHAMHYQTKQMPQTSDINET